jgi:cysteate synthase
MLAPQQAPAGDRHYKLVCRGCGAHHADDGLLLTCPEDHAPALLRTHYAAHAITPRADLDGPYRWRDWLPVVRTLDVGATTVVYRGERLGAALGLSALWVAFSGYWPERGAAGETGTFKDLEAQTVLGRLPAGSGPLVVSSAGNTAAAFGAACSRLGVPCLLVVPDAALATLRLRRSLGACVKVVALEGADYGDAVEFGRAVAALPGFHLEGGAHNVGRRDGLATVLYSAVEAIGAVPAYYVQAIGSGVGAIAVHEGAGRLLAGEDGAVAPRMLLVQNEPFTPIVDAWRAGRNGIGPRSAAVDRRDATLIRARELSNRLPPYAVAGGVRDVLAESDGDMLAAGNSAACRAAALFAEIEGIDVEPAAAVALAALAGYSGAGRIPPGATVLLHVTGGGRARLATDVALAGVEPALCLSPREAAGAAALERVAALFRPAPAGLGGPDA